MEYLTLKLIHIVSSTLLFGTGLGTAFYMVRAHLSRNIDTLRVTSASVVFADWLFTAPTVIIQPITGFYLMKTLNYSFESTWFYLVVSLYALAGILWIPVVFIQIKLKRYAASAYSWQLLDAKYFKLYKIWFVSGIPAFLSIGIIFTLMVFKPYL